jgi:hypothetical protein
VNVISPKTEVIMWIFLIESFFFLRPFGDCGILFYFRIKFFAGKKENFHETGHRDGQPDRKPEEAHPRFTSCGSVE